MNPPGHELTGTRIVGELPSVDMVMLWKTVSSAVVKRGFVLEYRDLEPPRTGIFDGLRIVLDPDVGFEMQCFLLLHLFGHSVQWVAPSLEHKLEDLQHTQDRATFMRVLHAYELEAAGFGAAVAARTRCHRARSVVRRLRRDRLAVRRALLRDRSDPALAGMRRDWCAVDPASADPAVATSAGGSAVRVLSGPGQSRYLTASLQGPLRSTLAP